MTLFVTGGTQSGIFRNKVDVSATLRSSQTEAPPIARGWIQSLRHLSPTYFACTVLKYNGSLPSVP
jgi:hypothetical protein